MSASAAPIVSLSFSSAAKRQRVGEERKEPVLCNTLRLVPLLGLDALGRLALLSKDMYSLLKNYFKDLRMFDLRRLLPLSDRENARVAFGLLRCCTQLRSLHTEGCEYRLGHGKFRQRLLSDCIYKNRNTLETATTACYTLPMLSALASCSRLTSFRDKGLQNSTNSIAYNAAIRNIVASVPSLTDLDLGGSLIEPEDDEEADEDLERWLTPVTMQAVLASCSPLRRLSLHNATTAEAASLSRLTDLCHLSVEESESGLLPALAVVLPKLNTLESLVVRADEDDGQPTVWRLPSSVTSLRLSGSGPAPNIVASGLREAAVPFTPEVLLSVLSSNHGITKLSVREECPIDAQTAAVLLQRTRLTSLHVDAKVVDAALFIGLPALPALEHLRMPLPASTHPRDVPSVIATLPHLRTCVLVGTDFVPALTASRAALSAPVRLSQLTQLMLPLWHDSLVHLSLPKLAWLSLDGALTDQSPLPALLRAIPRLYVLKLGGRSLSDNGLRAALAETSSFDLRDLSLRGCGISVMSLVNLCAPMRLCPELRLPTVQDCFEQPGEAIDVDIVVGMLEAMPYLHSLDVGVSAQVREAVRAKAASLKRRLLLT